ncbi:MAG: gliding motility-associated C-terminal domain-containing protein [Bacteroidales bacterium]|jgi:gliding motility-associated-like protein|nr:gliding motility-associated C-terminal domain-containing protein [Bacteroidales bacterium]
MKISRLTVILFAAASFALSLRSAACAGQSAPADSIMAPNVFTPNGDQKNDLFVVYSVKDQPVTLRVYTRAGVTVFSITAKRCLWDGCSLSGEKMASGVYFYTAEISGSSPKITKSGFVHLFR